MKERESGLVFACVFAIVLQTASVDATAADVTVIDNGEPSLCEALRVQTAKSAGRRESFCSLPTADSLLGLQRPDWGPIEPSAIEPLLQQHLPLFGWDTRDVQTLIRRTMPQATRDELLSEYWRRYGAAMMDALRSGSGLLESTMMDVDNDGSDERVYRTVVLRPIERDHPELGWRPLPCDRPSDAPTDGPAVIPYRAIFFDDSKQREMGTMALFDKIEAHDLFLFKGRSYLTMMGPSSVSAARIQVQKLPNTPQQALVYQVCSIHRSF